MLENEFNQLQVGDKVCLEQYPSVWGYIEDINKEINNIEFDLQERTKIDINGKEFNFSIGQEMSTHYYFVKLLEKAKPNTNDDYKNLSDKYDDLYTKYSNFVNDLMKLLEKY